MNEQPWQRQQPTSGWCELFLIHQICYAPLSKQRNKHLQTTLIEAAKMAPRYSPTLALLYDKERQKGNTNRATLAVARKLVAHRFGLVYFAADRIKSSQQPQ